MFKVCLFSLPEHGVPESVLETYSVVLTFEPVDEILWCDTNETSSAVLLHGTISFSIFYKMKFGIFIEFCSLELMGVTGYNLALFTQNNYWWFACRPC